MWLLGAEVHKYIECHRGRMQLNIKINVSVRCSKCGARLDAAEEIPSLKYDSIIVIDPHVCGVLTLHAMDLAKIGEDRTVEATVENGKLVDDREIRPSTNT